jgi:hypothetical protein
LDEMLREIAKGPVPQSAGLTLEDQEPRAIALGSRSLGDQIGWQGVIEIGYAERSGHGGRDLRTAPSIFSAG